MYHLVSLWSHFFRPVRFKIDIIVIIVKEQRKLFLNCLINFMWPKKGFLLLSGSCVVSDILIFVCGLILDHNTSDLRNKSLDVIISFS